MIKNLIKKLKTLRLYFVRYNKAEIGCGTCEHKHLLMSDKPCLNCVGRYSEWKQAIDSDIEKIKRIKQIQEHFENGDIFFDKSNADKTIIDCNKFL